MLIYCGFDVTISFGAMQATLHLPAFTKGIKSQLSAAEVKQTIELLLMSAHMWNVLLALSGKGFQFFKALIIADSFLIRKKGEKAPLID